MPRHARLSPVLYGVLVTTAVIAGVELFQRSVVTIPNPGPLYITAVAYAAFRGGLRAGAASALFMLSYVALAFSNWPRLFHYTPDNAVRVTVILLTTPLIALMVGVLQRQARLHAEAQVNSLALRQSKEWLVTTLQSIGDAVITTDTRGHITFMNPVAERLTGWSEEEACDLPIETVFRLLDEAMLQTIENPVRRVLAGEAIVLCDHAVLVRRDGAAGPIEASGTPICEGGSANATAAGKPEMIGAVLVFRDLQARRQSEEALQHSEQRYHSLVDATAQIIWTTPPEGVVADMPMWRAYTGQSLEEVRGWGWLDAIHPDDREHTQAAWERAVAAKSVYETEYRIRRRDGEYRPFWVRGVPVLEENGTIREWVGACTDISKRKQAEQERHTALTQHAHSNAALAGVLSQIADGVIVADASGRVTFANEAMLRLHGVHQAGATIFDYAAPCQWKTLDGEPCPPKELPLARAVLRQEVVTGVELIVVRPDGSELVVQDNAAPVTAPDGSFLGAVLTVRDVTAQRQLMTELVRVNRMKDEFLAILSHELRTPLTPILGWASLLRQTKGRNEEILDQAAEAIERNAETQKRLIEDLLDTTRMISGKLSIEVRPANLNDLIALTVASAERAVIGRDIRIEAELDERLPQLDIDEVRMQQVLWNLLSNAIKFSHDGGTIQVRSRLAGGQSDHAPTHAEVEVRDQGQGIVPDVLPHIFELFRQGDSSYTRRHGGLGLGLAITRSLVEMHGGTIEAKSAGEECGTQFLIRLPLPRQEKLPGTTRI